jgi:hypothetical protein
MSSVTPFLIDAWSWGMTWGWYQLALGLLCSTTIFMGMLRRNSLPALMMTLVSYWSAFTVYLIFFGFSYTYIIYINHSSIQIVYGILLSLCVALLFSLTQAFFLHLIHQWYRIQLHCVLWVTLTGNICAAALASLLTYMNILFY